MRAFFIIFGIVSFASPLLLNAQIVITEIMYDLEGTDTGREWIEIRNTGTDPIDLTTWKLFEANSNHSITTAGDTIVPSGGFAIIADSPDKFKADNTGFTGILFDSAFSLNNTGETLSMRNPGGAETDSVAYSSSIGASGNGFSLQKGSSGWIAATPTPGVDTVATASESPPSDSGSSSTATSQNDTEDNPTAEGIVIVHSSHSNQSVANGSYDEPELIVTSGRPRLGYVGVPLSFEAKVKSMKNMPLGNTVGNTWSMGDGAQKSGQFISHMYDFPGEYTVILNSSAGGASAVSKVKVKIVEPKVIIREANTSYIEIENSDSFELNLGNWILETKDSRFIIPQDTIIAPRSSLKLSSKITHISDPSGFVQIGNPSRKIIASKTHLPPSDTFSAAPFGDIAITMPFELSEDVLRERLAMVSHGIAARQAPLAVENQMISVSSQEPITSTDAVAVSINPTSTMPAAVIYTIKDISEKGWWDKIIGLFNE